jgi:hypothetical protein
MRASILRPEYIISLGVLFGHHLNLVPRYTLNPKQGLKGLLGHLLVPLGSPSSHFGSCESNVESTLGNDVNHHHWWGK